MDLREGEKEQSELASTLAFWALFVGRSQNGGFEKEKREKK